MVSQKRLKSEIDKAVRDGIHSGKITNVVVSEGTGADDEEIIRVQVIYDNKSKLLDAHETLAVAGEVRDRLGIIGEERFPVFYWIAKSEAGKLAEA
jgi:hypothetical protein